MKDLDQQLRSDAKPEKPRCAPHRARENTFNAQRRQGRGEDKRERQAKHHVGSREPTKQNQIDPATCFFKYCAAQAATRIRRRYKGWKGSV